MAARATLAAVLLFAVLAGVVPDAQAAAPRAPATEGLFRPVERPSHTQVAALLERPALTQAEVFDGRYVPAGAHPYVGLVLTVDPGTGAITGICSGSLIRPRYVLTAGHCTRPAKAAVFIPRVVDLRAARPKHVFAATAIATAPRYSARTLRDDVGLLRLGRAVKVKPVTVAGAVDDVRYGPGTQATVVGWGAVDRRLKLPTRLRRGAVEVQPGDLCAGVWGPIFRARAMVCAGSEVTNACVGDSGGPLLVRDPRGRWLLLGTTSFGRDPCSPGLDTVYMRASSVRGWIERATGLPPRA
ncbi:MAG TPA: serine protease [Euzebyales bacterium]|nr:serine protease [Euzebyales bacterium]